MNEQLVVKVGADISSYSRAMKSLPGHAANAANSIVRSFFSIKTMLIGLAGAAGIGLLSKSFLQAAIDAGKFERQLRGVYMGNEQAAKQAMKWMEQFALKSTFALDDIVQSFVEMKAAGINVTTSMMNSMGNIGALMGRTMGDVSHGMISLAQRSLRYLGIQIEQSGNRVIVASGKMRKVVVDDNDKIREAILELWEKKFPNAMKEADASWSGLISDFGDMWHLFRVEIMKSGPFDFLKDQIRIVRDQMLELWESGEMKKWARNVAMGMLEIMDKLLKIASEGFPILMQFTSMFVTLAKWVSTIPIGLKLIYNEIDRLIPSLNTMKDIYTEAILTWAESTLAESDAMVNAPVEQAKSISDALKSVTEARKNHSAELEKSIKGWNKENEAIDQNSQQLINFMTDMDKGYSDLSNWFKSFGGEDNPISKALDKSRASITPYLEALKNMKTGEKEVADESKKTADALGEEEAAINKLSKETMDDINELAKKLKDFGKTDVEILKEQIAMLQKYGSEFESLGVNVPEAINKINKEIVNIQFALMNELTKLTKGQLQAELEAVEQKKDEYVRILGSEAKALELIEAQKKEIVRQAYEGINEDIIALTATRYELEVARMNNAIEAYRRAGISEAEIEKWKNAKIIELDKVRVDEQIELVNQYHEAYIKALKAEAEVTGNVQSALAAGWVEYFDGLGTQADSWANLMKDSLDAIHEYMADTFYNMLSGDLEKNAQLWDDFVDRIKKAVSDMWADQQMKGLEKLMTEGWLGKVLEKFGLGDLVEKIKNAGKSPTLLELEKQTKLLGEISNKISPTTAEQTGIPTGETTGTGTDYGKYLGWIKRILSAYQGYQSGGWSGAATGLMGGGEQSSGSGSILSMFGNNTQSGGSGISQFGGGNIMNMFGGGGGGGGGVAAGSMGPGEYWGAGGTGMSVGTPATTTGGSYSMMGAGGGGWGAVGSYGGMLMSAYQLYQMSGSDFRNQYSGPSERTKQKSGQTRYSGMVSGGIQGAMAGSSFGGVGAGAGAIYGAVMGFKAGEKAEKMDKRIDRYEDYMKDLDKLMKSEYSNLMAMSRNFGSLTSNVSAAAAISIGGASGVLIEYMHMMAEALEEQEHLSDRIGEMGAISGLDMFSAKTESMLFMIEQESPEAAKKIAEMQEKMHQLFKQDMLTALTNGSMSLRNVWAAIKDMNMDDLATMVEMYDTALQSLFTSTIPLGEVQLERLMEDIDKLKDKIEDEKKREDGWNILLGLLRNGLKLTGEEIEKFRNNIDNLTRLKYINIYHELGLDNMPLVEKSFDTFEEQIDAMRESLVGAMAVITQFETSINNMPDAMNETKAKLLGLAAALKYFTTITMELTDVIEDIGNMDDLLEGMKEAVEKGDLGAYLDDLQTLVGYFMDLIEVISQLNDLLGGSVEILTGLEDALIGIVGVIQIFYTLVEVFRLINTMFGFFVDWMDEATKLAGKFPDWEQQKKDFYNNILVPWSEFIRWIFNIIPGLGDLLAESMLADAKEWLNLDDEIQTIYKDIDQLYYAMTKLSEDAFWSMTQDIIDYQKQMKVGKFQPILDAEEMGRELGKYMAYLGVNWEDIAEMFENGNDEVTNLMETAGSVYKDMLDTLIEESLKPWEDFIDELNQKTENLTSQILKQRKIASGLSDEVAEWWYQMKELQRVRTEQGRVWVEWAAETDPAKRLELAKEAYDWELQAMDAELAANTAYYDELRRLAQEKYDEEKEQIQDLAEKLSDFSDRKDTFVQDIDDLLKDIRGAGGGTVDEFNKTRRDIAAAWQKLPSATGEERLDILDELKDLYADLWSLGGELYQDDWEAFTRLQEEASAGLTALKEQGVEIYDSEIDVLEDQLEELTGIKKLIDEDVDDYIKRAEKAFDKSLETYLDSLKQAEAANAAAIMTRYSEEISLLKLLIKDEMVTLETQIRDAFKAALYEFLGNAADYETFTTEDYLNQILTFLRDTFGKAPAPTPEDKNFNTKTLATISTAKEMTFDDVLRVMTDMYDEKTRGVGERYLDIMPDVNMLSELRWYIDSLAKELDKTVLGKKAKTDMITQLEDLYSWLKASGKWKQSGGIVSSEGMYYLHQGEIYNPGISGGWGREGAERKGLLSKEESKETVFMFVPYEISEQEKDRLVRDVVKPRLKNISKTERFLYDNAIIKSNRGV